MNLQLASVWLENDKAGFSGMQEFAVQCRDSARQTNRESAALVLLAERVNGFVDQYGGSAVPASDVAAFLGRLRADCKALWEASRQSDDAFFTALNDFAVSVADTLYL